MRFIYLIALSLLFGLPAIAQTDGDDNQPTFGLREVEPYVFVYRSPQQAKINTFVFVDADGLILADTQFEDDANKQLVNALREQFPDKKIKAVIITGLRFERFAGLPFLHSVYGKFDVWAPPQAFSQWQRVLDGQWEAYHNNGGISSKNDYPLPSREVNRNTTFNYSGNKAQVLAFSNAESKGNLAFFLTYGKTLLAGDLFNGYLNVDSTLNGNVAGWAAACTRLRALPSLRIFGGRDAKSFSLFDFDRFTRYLANTVAEYQSKINNRLTEAEFFEHFKVPKYIPIRNEQATLAAMYGQLKKQINE